MGGCHENGWLVQRCQRQRILKRRALAFMPDLEEVSQQVSPPASSQEVSASAGTPHRHDGDIQPPPVSPLHPSKLLFLRALHFVGGHFSTKAASPYLLPSDGGHPSPASPRLPKELPFGEWKEFYSNVPWCVQASPGFCPPGANPECHGHKECRCWVGITGGHRWWALLVDIAGGGHCWVSIPRGHRSWASLVDITGWASLVGTIG